MKYTRTKKRVYKSRKTVKKPTVSKSVKVYVKRQISKNIEDKIAVFQYPQSGISKTDTLTAPLTLNAIPSVNQGVEVCDRTGNKLKCKKLMFNCTISRSSLSPTTAVPQYVCVVIGRVKANYDTPVLSDFNLLKYQQTNTGAPTMGGIYSTDMRTLLSPYNKDVWDIKAVRYFKCFNASGMPNPFVNNDFNILCDFRMDLTKYVKKIWTYSNTTSQPENEGLYVNFYAVNIDSSVTFPAVISVDAVSHLYYEDA